MIDYEKIKLRLDTGEKLKKIAKDLGYDNVGEIKLKIKELYPEYAILNPEMIIENCYKHVLKYFGKERADLIILKIIENNE